jgi:Uma2 family endonuclease
MKALLDLISQLDEARQAKVLALAQLLLEEQQNKVQEDNASYESSSPTEFEEISEEEEEDSIITSYYDVNQDSFSAEDIQAIIDQFPKKRKWTFADLQNEYIFPKEHFVKIEIINFKIYVMPDPTTLHQEILTLLSAHLTLFVSSKRLGKTMVAPVSIKIDEGNVLKPDIIFLSLEQIESNPDLITPQGIQGVPHLVVEVISPANYKKRREAKKQRYAEGGVLEYWELKPKKKSITIETLEEGEYKIYSEAKKTGAVRSKILEGFEVELSQIYNVGMSFDKEI